MNQPSESAPVALGMMLWGLDDGHSRGRSACFGDRNVPVLRLRRCVPHTTEETRSAEAFFDPRRTERSTDALGLQAHRCSVHVRGYTRLAMTMDDSDGARLG